MCDVLHLRNLFFHKLLLQRDEPPASRKRHDEIDALLISEKVIGRRQERVTEIKEDFGL